MCKCILNHVAQIGLAKQLVKSYLYKRHQENALSFIYRKQDVQFLPISAHQCKNKIF